MVEPVEDGEAIRWAAVLAAIDPRESKMNWLLLAIPVAIWLSLVEHNQPMAFITSMVAIMPLAYMMGRATEEFALRTSESVGGLDPRLLYRHSPADSRFLACSRSIRASIKKSMSPSSTVSRAWDVTPVRWSVTRFWGKL